MFKINYISITLAVNITKLVVKPSEPATTCLRFPTVLTIHLLSTIAPFDC